MSGCCLMWMWEVNFKLCEEVLFEFDVDFVIVCEY